MTVNKILKETAEEIGYDKAKILIEYVLKTDRNHLIFSLNTHLDEKQEKEYKRLVEKVKRGEPVQYLTGKAYFMGLKFIVNKNVLIPQPDTEILVEEALKQIELKQKSKQIIKVLDLCTGSGAIALSIAKGAKNVEIYASDVSKRALKVAEKNYDEIINSEINVKNKIINSKIISTDDLKNEKLNGDKKEIKEKNKVTFIKSDMFKNIKEKFDIIVTNPPYIKKDVIKTLDREVRKEPKIALNGGKDGLKFYRIIRENINKYLNDEGVLLMEIGFDQKEEVEKLFENSTCVKDFGGNDRVIIWKK